MPDLAEILAGRADKNINGCWEWNKYLNSDGYAHFKWRGKTIAAHRCAWELTNGSIPKGMLVLHHCDVRHCINPEHLFLGTDADNMKDAAVKNRLIHKLALLDISEIRRLYIEGFRQIEIAKMFSICQGHVSKIISRKRRQYV